MGRPITLSTGGVANVLLFLDELIGLGYTGQDDAIVKVRDAGRAYIRDTLPNSCLARSC